MAQEYINDNAADSIKVSRDKKFDMSKVYAGGGLGFQFGNYTFIDISPVFGYRFTSDRQPQRTAGNCCSYPSVPYIEKPTKKIEC